MRKLVTLGATIALAASACAGGGGTRTVLVDYSHDQFASFLIANFPSEVAVHPGDEILFKQTWTGEPHTVTGGTTVDKLLVDGYEWIRFFTSFDGMRAAGVDLPDPEDPANADVAWSEIFRTIDGSKEKALRTKFLSAYSSLRKQGVDLPSPTSRTTLGRVNETIGEDVEPLFSSLRFAFDEESGDIAQNVGQRCYLRKGEPPKDPGEPCTDENQRQPAFDGEASYYNSGVIPYQGPEGNTFKVRFTDDIEPGDYYFFCSVHGPGQTTKVSVKPKGMDIPSAEDTNRAARAELEEFSKPFLKMYKDAQDGTFESEGGEIRGPFAGLGSNAVEGSINEFLPRTITTKVGRKVTWKMVGSDHTISFDVPRYFPILRFAKNGNISLNPRLDKPAGGSPAPPEQGEDDEGPIRVDGGTYDGSGFFSSGLFGSNPYAEYSLRFSKPGRYRYACLIHPPMVGTVVVEP